MSNKSIGIFDSGIGGLTVANAISALLPNESIVYFGDTAHLPYGDKSAKAIRQYGKKIMQFLVSQECKTIVIACNSASASIGNSYKNWIPAHIPVVNVIDPVIEKVIASEHKTIGLIGTKRTVSSGVFAKKTKQLNAKKTVKSLATPLLAPMIEEGFYNNNISKTIIKSYLSNNRLNGIESLILACTHYPLIASEIAEVTAHKIHILNSAQIVAEKLQAVLTEQGLLKQQKKESLTHAFFVSDYTHGFENAAKRFFGEKIKLKEISKLKF